MSLQKFVFKNSQTIGAAAAEQDKRYLYDCFVDTGVLETLLDCEDHRCILDGRTGAGKSALIAMICEQQEHVIPIGANSLSLEYIANSNIINFFAEAGTNLNLFYRLLWRHVFVVEILGEKFGSAPKTQGFSGWIRNCLGKNENHRMALDYLSDWSDSFWKETDHRVKEVTHKLEKDLGGVVTTKLPKIGDLNLTAARKLTEEQKAEVSHLGQEVVNKVQIKELNAIVKVLDEILLTDRQKKYYLVIDKLDEDWVEEKLRFRLIRELIETGMAFTNQISNVKVVISLRNDLLDRVYRYTRDTGFQEEKYTDSSIKLLWTKRQLIEVLDNRINKLVKNKYTNKLVSSTDVMRGVKFNKYQVQLASEYMIERTLLRPRDLIQFFNTCIEQADGEIIISNHALFEAEGIYSRGRFRALIDEWFGIYPNLGLISQILRGMPPKFLVGKFTKESLEDGCLQALTNSDLRREGKWYEEMNGIVEERFSVDTYRINLVSRLYKVGLIGLKSNNSMPVSWSFIRGSSISKAEIFDESEVHIQKAFWRYFGVKPPTKR